VCKHKASYYVDGRRIQLCRARGAPVVFSDVSEGNHMIHDARDGRIGAQPQVGHMSLHVRSIAQPAKKQSQ